MDDRLALPDTEAEIEITPEMIEAGVIALAGYDESRYSLEEGAVDIYLAMAAKSPNQGEKRGA